jgi:hypothetical protein
LQNGAALSPRNLTGTLYGWIASIRSMVRGLADLEQDRVDDPPGHSLKGTRSNDPRF